MMPSDRTGDNGHKSKHMKFYLNTKKHLFVTVNLVKHWNMLLRVCIPGGIQNLTGHEPDLSDPPRVGGG